MSPQLKMLLWKEWRERRWQFLLCLTWVCGTALLGVLWTTHGWREWECRFLPYSLLMPIFVAMATARGETTDRTQTFSAGLPVGRQRLARIRLAGGLAVLVVPLMIVAAMVAICVYFNWVNTGSFSAGLGDPPWIPLRFFAAFAWLTSCLYLLLCLLGTVLRTELQLGLTAVVVTILWAISIVFVLPQHPLARHLPLLAAVASAITPDTLTIFADVGPGKHGREGSLVMVAVPLVLNLVLQCLIAMQFVRRFGRPRSPSIARRRWRIGVGSPLRLREFSSPRMALVWLTLRQAVPLCLPGLAVIFLILLVAMIFESPQPHNFERIAEGIPRITGLVTIVWAAIVGAGTFADEIDARLGNSWRSWPISMWQFFGIKYLVGLVAVLAVLDGPAAAVAWRSAWLGNPNGINGTSVMVTLHAMLFSLAVAWSCVLRRSTLGAMAAFLSYLFVGMALASFNATAGYEPLGAFNTLSGWWHRGLGASFLVVLAGMGLTIAVSIAVAYRSLTRLDAPRWWRVAARGFARH